MATVPTQLSSDDMDDDTRDYINCNSKEGVTPEGTFSDWGDCDNDHTEKAAAAANGYGDDPAENAINFFSSQATGTVNIPGVGGRHED